MNAAARISYPVRVEVELEGEIAVESDEQMTEGFAVDPRDCPVDDAWRPDDHDEDRQEDCEDEEVLSARELGIKGEEAAARYLELRGYEIVHRNWSCRFGEADIIARDDDGTLCFIEVKTRRGVDAGLPEEAITAKKQARYERIALCYLMQDEEWQDNDPVRFDAIGICVSAPHKALLRHHRGCFNGCF